MKTNKIAFVVDGYYGLSLYRYAKSEFGKIINFEGLVNSACTALENIIQEKCISPASLRHYYMGTDLNNVNSVRNEYETALKLSRFGARGRPLQNGKEKCIDTMLFSDIKDEATAGVFDYLILLAGDLDHITLVQDLKSLGIKTVLLYGEIITNGIKTTGYSHELRDSCFNAVDLFEILDNGDVFKNTKYQHTSMTELMRTPMPKTSIVMEPKNPAVQQENELDKEDLTLKGVVDAVQEVISEKEKIEGQKVAFALQAQVGTQLKKNGVELPVGLKQYLESYPQIFRTGTHPVTQALTVSVKDCA